MSMVTMGAAMASRTATETTRDSTGRAVTRPTRATQKRLSPAFERSSRRPITGTLSELTRSPSRPSSAGSRVRAATTATTPTRMAPAARLRMTLLGTSRR